jgi:hypothetical protein
MRFIAFFVILGGIKYWIDGMMAEEGTTAALIAEHINVLLIILIVVYVIALLVNASEKRAQKRHREEYERERHMAENWRSRERAYLFFLLEEAGSITILLLIVGVILRLLEVEITGRVWFVFTYVFLFYLASTAILFVILVCFLVCWSLKNRGSSP